MKNKICLLLCALLLLSCVPGLAGCSAAERSPETPVVETVAAIQFRDAKNRRVY